jgi:hypothetical protein
MTQSIDSARQAATAGILQRFGMAYAQAEQTVVPEAGRRAAARVALEFAVLQTGAEKGVDARLVANALAHASPQHQAMMVREGRAAMERAYGGQAELVAAAAAGKVVPVPLPKGFASNPEFDKLIDAARNTVTGIIQETYTNRGRFETGGARSEIVDVRQGSAQAAKNDLTARLAFLASAIDAGVASGKLTETSAAMLKERVEAFVFQPRPPQSLSFSKEFHAYFEASGPRLRQEVMKDVRGVVQSSDIKALADQVDKIKPAEPPRRQIADLER